MAEATPISKGLSDSADFAGQRRRVCSVPAPLTIHEPTGSCKGQVLIVPGWSGPRSGPADLLVHLATQLCGAGYRVLRLDLPGRGDCTTTLQPVDLDAMIETAFLAHGSFIKPTERTFILGLCSGGNVALGVVTTTLASQLDLTKSWGSPAELNRVGVIALSTLPFQPARSKQFEQKRRWRNIKQYAAKALSPRNWLRLIRGEINLARVKKNVTATEKPAEGARNLKDSARDIEQALLHWSGPALFVWGGGDEEAPLARAHFEALHVSGMGARERTVFHTIEGANHNYYAKAWREELSRTILEFVAVG